MDSNSKFQNHEKIVTAMQHEHPLQLVDLQPRYPDYVEFSDDEEEDRVIRWDFNHTCNQCHKDINVYHRYYYKCTDSCDYALHTLCAKLPAALVVKSHSPSHTLTLETWSNRYFFCSVCGKWGGSDNLCYGCSICDRSHYLYNLVHVKCAMIGRENHIIYHPSHPHPLQSVTSEPSLYTCDACGKKHMGIFYHCTTCFHHNIHIDCAILPRKLHIQHTHPLIISYSSEDITYGNKCRICREPFYPKYFWSYNCESCRYYVHLNCATSRNEPFMSIFLSAGTGKMIKNFKDADHPNLVNLPFPDHTYSILQHRFSKELGSTSERNLNHINHQHVLSLVGTQSNASTGATSSSGVRSLSCHDPMKRIELLCNGCVRPIMDVPFYKCSSEDQCCDFVLHEWCTRLPAELPNHPGHKHTLTFLPKVLNNIFGIFDCKICTLRCNGFAYGCTECEYYIDVNCGFIPDEITHEAHPDHILSRCEGRKKDCVADGWSTYIGSEISFSCRSCDFYLHSDCALFLPRIIHHKLDKHPMRLTYGPVENHKSEYFCEVCEEELNPNLWFYHCHVCAYSLHTRCAPVILNFEAAYNNGRSVYEHLNIKVGGTYDIEGHEHSVSLAIGLSADGECSVCDYPLRGRMIIKCLSCKFAVHLRHLL